MQLMGRIDARAQEGEATQRAPDLKGLSRRRPNANQIQKGFDGKDGCKSTRGRGDPTRLRFEGAFEIMTRGE